MDEKALLRGISIRIREVRQAKGITQQELAAKIDYEKSNMSRLESGKTDLRISTLNKVAKALDMSLSELLDFE